MKLLFGIEVNPVSAILTSLFSAITALFVCGVVYKITEKDHLTKTEPDTKESTKEE